MPQQFGLQLKKEAEIWFWQELWSDLGFDSNEVVLFPTNVNFHYVCGRIVRFLDLYATTIWLAVEERSKNLVLAGALVRFRV
jgi:hypothetical protein